MRVLACLTTLAVLAGCAGEGTPAASPSNPAAAAAPEASSAEPQSKAADAEPAAPVPTAEGGPPIDPAAIPPGKGWYCFRGSIGRLWCERTKDACENFRQGNVRLVLKQGGTQADADSSVGACEAKTTMWCHFYKKDDGSWDHSCSDDKDECLMHAQEAAASSTTASGCANVP